MPSGPFVRRGATVVTRPVRYADGGPTTSPRGTVAIQTGIGATGCIAHQKVE
jgi:hypothetical protein